MDKKIAGLIGAVGAFASLSTAQASTSDPQEVLRVNSFADLLDPIPNAMEKLRAVDQSTDPGRFRTAQYYGGDHHHHHHHHNSYYRGYGDGPRIVVVPRYRYRDGYDHHHHHHHNNYYRRYREY